VYTPAADVACLIKSAQAAPVVDFARITNGCSSTGTVDGSVSTVISRRDPPQSNSNNQINPGVQNIQGNYFISLIFIFLDDMSTTPALPPGLADLNSVSRDEFFSSMERHPLFMHNLDGTDSENIELEALRALAYEGTPREVALNFKEQGNEAFREKRYRDALEFYTKGIAVKSGENEIEEPLLLNRAAVNLELSMLLLIC
jgi:hypothetical protein